MCDISMMRCVDGFHDSFSPPDIQEEMAKASLDVNFKEELSAIEQCEDPSSR